MSSSKIQLSDINKMLIYEQQSRLIDNLTETELKEFAKRYLKLYLKQQEILSKI
jgi:hypothetical protein